MGKRRHVPLCGLLAFLLGSCSDGTGPAASLPLHFTAIAVNNGSTCGLTDDGSLYCWGNGSGGLFGSEVLPECALGTVTCSTRPRRIASPAPLTAIAMNSSFGSPVGYACGLDADGAAYCWGTIIDVDQGHVLGEVPTILPGGVSLRSISTGFQHICGVAATHEAYCWGSFEGGVRGDPLIDFDTSHATFEPNVVGGGLTFISIAAGTVGTCGVTTDHQGYCWGSNNFGGLGDPNAAVQSDCGIGFSPCAPAPVPIAAAQQFDSISGAGNHFCARTSAGLLYCWGSDNSGQIGVDSLMSNADCCVPQPERVYAPGLSFASVSAGYQSTCALDQTGVGYCWGANGTGQAGYHGQSLVPAPVLGDHRFTAMAVASDHGCGITAEGIAFCWGNNSFGHWGTGDDEPSIEPVPVVGPEAH
jgi:hypothetical protein